MATTTITLDDLTDGNILTNADNEYEWSGTGVFDELMDAVNKNVKIQYDEGRIVDSDYANVYLGSIQSVISNSIQFLLQSQLQAAQIDSVLADTALKASQLAAQRNKDEAELEKQWGYDVTRDLDNNLVLGTSTGNGKIDEELVEIQERVDLLQSQDAELLANGLVERDVKVRQIVETEATGTKQRLAIDKDNLLKDDELIINSKKKAQLDADTAERLDSTTRANTKLDDELLTAEKQRTLLDTEEEAKQFEVDNMLPKQETKLDEEIDLLQTQDSELLANGLTERDVKERQILEAEITGSKQRDNLDAERKVIEQKIVGRKQSTITEE